MKIGWIGLGNMGIPMASNLINAGYDMLVWNRSETKAEPLLSLGARFADKPSALIEQCDIVFTMVSDEEAVKAIYTREEGLLSRKGTNKIAVDMSTVSPATSRLLAERCQAEGIHFLDAPVSGSVGPAREGQLIIMAGGDSSAFAKVKPLFEKLGKLALHLGPNGAGSTGKLAINMLLGITVQGVAESLLFAREHGVATEEMLTIITESAVGAPLIRGKAASILANDFPAAFALKHMAKDLRLAQETGAPTPLAESANASFQAALHEGLGDQDLMAIIRFLNVRTRE